jgi:glycerol kinase
MVESTALGAAKLAARGVGLPLREPDTAGPSVRVFTPTISEAARTIELDRWRSAVAKA